MRTPGRAHERPRRCVRYWPRVPALAPCPTRFLRVRPGWWADPAEPASRGMGRRRTKYEFGYGASRGTRARFDRRNALLAHRAILRVMGGHLQRSQCYARCTYRGAAPAAVNDGAGGEHLGAQPFERFDDVLRAAAGGDYVFDYHRGVAGR